MKAALAWLYSLADQERGVGWNPRASPDTQWKLGRTRALLDLAGAPDRRLRIALVAGTNGKGSTCATLASILGAGGTRCGLYTQPHLQSYLERVRVDGQAIQATAFSAAVERFKHLVEGLPADAGEPTTFEVTTALALDHFARENCEVAVVEVGLGGRLDATNATEPCVSVIASIGHDHMAVLGRSLASIAQEKAGIVRAGRPAILAQQRPAALRALRQACRQVGAECRVVPPLQAALPQAGKHQRQNAALAVTAATILCPGLPQTAVQTGLARVRWPGRFEVVAGDPPLVLDGAHNPEAAAALAPTLREFAAGRPVTLVLGILADKAAVGVLRPLLSVADQVWTTQAHDTPRALDPVRLASLCRRLGMPAQPEPDLATALAQAQRSASQKNGVVCVTGSLLLVGQTRSRLGLAPPLRLW
jgi:dihydrofolate synthase / folylpolyglutamate synthase